MRVEAWKGSEGETTGVWHGNFNHKVIDCSYSSFLSLGCIFCLV